MAAAFRDLIALVLGWWQIVKVPAGIRLTGEALATPTLAGEGLSLSLLAGEALGTPAMTGETLV